MRRFQLCLLVWISVVACRADAPRSEGEAGRVSPELITSQASAAEDRLALARRLTGLQRDLFGRLADPQSDPAPLLAREFHLIDRADSLTWQKFDSSRPFAQRDDYLGILVSRLPAEELTSDRFDLWRQEDGSVVVVSHLADGRINLTVWVPDGPDWKARAIVVNAPLSEQQWMADNLQPLLAG